MYAGVLQRWGEFGRLAYSSCFMKVAESWAFGMIVLLAGLLPDPDRSVASASITFNAYGVTFMVFLAESIAVSTRCRTPHPLILAPAGCLYAQALSRMSADPWQWTLSQGSDIQGSKGSSLMKDAGRDGFWR